MKILLTIHHPLDPDSGAPGSVLKLGNAYQQLGHEVVYYSFDNLPTWVPGMATGLVFPELMAAYLSKACRNQDLDVIDASTGDAWVWGIIHHLIKHRPLLVTRSHGLEHAVHFQNLEDARQGHLQLSWKYPLYHGGFRLWEVATSLRCADLVFVLNHQDLKFVTENLGVCPESAVVCPNGIPEAFLNLPFSQLPSHLDTIGIAVIGSYILRKGIQYSVPALKTILNQYPQVQVSFMGTECEASQVYADFDVSLHDRITVLSHFDHNALPTLLKNHQIKLFTPLTEGFGKVLLEAMACGLAPITTAAAGPLEVVQDSYDAIVVPIRDQQAIEAALETLITNPSCLGRIRQNAYKTAQTYSWMQCAQQRLGLYEAALVRRMTA